MPYMYIVRCADATYYVGSTWNVERRVAEHASGVGAAYTRRRPVELVYAEWYDRIDDAFAREKQVQNWSRRKREALITGDFDALPGLSARGPSR
ncbi:GIY-YIG nuclease family protein [Leifsonia kafniensis]|uniref:GIY-YIG nuclease family protein n=1 Tax=Leifsonia kafniensis TaxID=475957 RepID=A0ABP7L159_9MICO